MFIFFIIGQKSKLVSTQLDKVLIQKILNHFTANMTGMFLGWFLPNVCLLKYKMAATAGHSFIIGRPLWENRKIIFSMTKPYGIMGK